MNDCKSCSRSLLIAAFFCIILYVVGIACRPIFPVDETRYLTVAWEMYVSHNWILPHLNYEAYDHKPPLLFWSILLLWKIFGVSQEAAMAVPFIFAFLFVAATQRLAKKIIPDDPKFPSLVTYILIGTLPFLVYSNMIMFDLILGVFSTLGITAVWDYAKTKERKHLALYTLAVGLGAITKGPVILLQTIFPILFVKFWNVKNSASPNGKNWALGFIAAIIGGTILGLCWAIPAAIEGGPAFANKIFWGQTAGRVANSFAHNHPFGWYFKFLPAFLLPWAFSPLFWRGIKDLKNSPHKEVLKFLGIWILPVFLCFCCISGKQVHYLLPLLSGVAIFTALVFQQAAKTFKRRDVVIPFLVTGILILSPLLIKFGAQAYPALLDGRRHADGILDQISVVTPLLLFAASAGLVAMLGLRSMKAHVLTISFSTLLLMLCFQLESKDTLFKNYDLRPMAEIIQKNPNAPLAFGRNYHGEWGFLARLNRPVQQLDPEQLEQWFKVHPNGMAFLHTGESEDVKAFDTIYSMPYKMDDSYNIIVKRGQAAHFSK